MPSTTGDAWPRRSRHGRAAANPGLKAGRVAEVRELAPGRDEGALQGVLGEIAVAQDPDGDRVQPVAGRMDQ